MDKQKGFLEESLAESQGKDVCRAIFDGSPDAIFLADPKTGLILDANPAAEQLLGRPLGELIGLHQSELHPQKREKASRSLFSRHSATDGKVRPGPDEHYAIRADGTEIPIEITANVIRIKGRKVLQGFFRDVSTRRAAELSMRESEERYRTLVSHAPIGIVVHKDGVMRFVNQKLAELGGFEAPSQLVGRKIHDFIHPDSRTLVTERLVALARNGRPLPPAEHRLITPDGRVLDMEMTSIPITYQGETCFMSIIQDVTDRKRDQEALRESEERYRTLVDHAQVGIVVQKRGLVKFANRAMAKIVKTEDPALLIGRNALDFIHPDSAKAAKPRLSLGALNHRPPVEEKFIAADGSVVEVEILTVPITYLGETCTLGIVLDITDRKLAELQLLVAHRKLLDANIQLEERVEQRTSQLEDLNKELEAFSYSAAHDLKAPLRRINVFSEMLEKEAGAVLGHDTHDYLVNIHKSVTHMTRLVDGLLSLSTTGRRQLDLQPVALGPLLDEVVAEVKAENPERAIDWRIQKLPEASCDRAMLRQVFINLLCNAAKYSRGRCPAVIEVLCTCGAREHIIAVRDNGIGFSMEYSDKIFGVFQRLHRSEDFEGTGIGLSTVKRIISRHGGRVWCVSEPGKGATFYFSLPTQ